MRSKFINYIWVDMSKFLYFFITVLVLSGCSATFKQNLFSDIRNDHVGMNKDLVIHPLSLVKIIPYNEKQDKYVCAYDDGCQWAYYVNKETGIIESWEFISSPDKCQTGLNWFGPW